MTCKDRVLDSDKNLHDWDGKLPRDGWGLTA